MAEQINTEQTEPSLYSYYDQKYDIDSFYNTAARNIDDYLSQFNIKEEDKQGIRAAAVDMMKRMKGNQSTGFDVEGIHFTNGDLSDKQKDKHYRQAAYYLNEVFKAMQPYKAPDPEALNLDTAGISDYFLKRLNGGSTEFNNFYKGDSASRRQQVYDALNATKNYYQNAIDDTKKYKVTPGLGLTNEEWLNGLDAVMQAVSTPNTKDDSVFNRYGLGEIYKLISDDKNDWLVSKEEETKVTQQAEDLAKQLAGLNLTPEQIAKIQEYQKQNEAAKDGQNTEETQTEEAIQNVNNTQVKGNTSKKVVANTSTPKADYVNVKYGKYRTNIINSLKNYVPYINSTAMSVDAQKTHDKIISNLRDGNDGGSILNTTVVNPQGKNMKAGDLLLGYAYYSYRKTFGKAGEQDLRESNKYPIMRMNGVYNNRYLLLKTLNKHNGRVYYFIPTTGEISSLNLYNPNYKKEYLILHKNNLL